VTGLVEIQLCEGETVESTLKRLKRKVVEEDIIRDIKRHSLYLKPGEWKATEIKSGTKAKP